MRLGGVGVAAVAALLVLLPGCGGGAASSDDVIYYCNERCGRDARCGGAEPACTSECQRREASTFGYFRGELYVALAECYHDLPCGAHDDTCANVALQRLAPAPLNNPDYQQCVSVRASCKAADQPTFPEDYCASAAALSDAGRERVADCYQRPCAQMRDCLKIVFD
jgi:hypothetical protein